MSDYVPKKFSPRGNLPHRNVLLALICLTLAVLALGVFGTMPFLRLQASGMLVIAVFAFAQFTYSAVARPHPEDETLTVKLYERAAWWMERFSRPLTVAGHNGQSVYVRDSGCDYREIYDRHGHLIGVEQTINWSYNDMDWNSGDPEEIVVKFTPAEKCKGEGKMSWLARLRSPTLPAVLAPEQAMHPISHLLNGRSEGFITNLTLKAA